MLSTTACSNVLGLDGLSFDQSAESQDTAAPSGGAGGTAGDEPKLVGPATGGAEGKSPTQEELWGFPATWSDAIIVAAQLPPSSVPRSAEEETTSSFHVYEPETGNLTSRRLREDGYDEVVSSWSPGFTIVIPRPSANGLGIFGYEAELGSTELAAPWDPWALPGNDASSPIDAETRDGSRDWTHLLTLRSAGTWLVVVHDQRTGLYRVGPAITDDPEGNSMVPFHDHWAPGWSTLLAYDLGNGEHGLLKAALDTGAVALEAFSEDGSLEILGEATWDTRWTHALTFMRGQAPSLLLYDSASGKAVRGHLDEELAFVEEESAYWARGWTTLTLVEVNEQSYALAYEASIARARLLALDPLDGSDLVVVR